MPTAECRQQSLWAYINLALTCSNVHYADERRRHQGFGRSRLHLNRRKEEWMKFMEAEFDRLDKDKKGQLDVKELTQSKLRVSHPVNVGK